jgi:hypothetical protein
MPPSPRARDRRETCTATVTVCPASSLPENADSVSTPQVLAFHETGPPTACSSSELSEPPAMSRNTGETTRAPDGLVGEGSGDSCAGAGGDGYSAVGGAEEPSEPSGNVADTGATSMTPFRPPSGEWPPGTGPCERPGTALGRGLARVPAGPAPSDLPKSPRMAASPPPKRIATMTSTARARAACAAKPSGGNTPRSPRGRLRGENLVLGRGVRSGRADCSGCTGNPAAVNSVTRVATNNR